MAYNFHHHLLLLLLVALLATSLHLISSTSPSPSPSSLPSFPPLSTPPPIILSPPPAPHSLPTILSPPPPPPPPSDFQQKQLNNIIDALIGAADYAGWANFISSTNLPLTATLFIPSNAALSQFPTATSMAAGINFDPFIIPYHIVPQRLSFQELQHFTTHTRLPTLLPSKYIIITNNSSNNFTIDDSMITHPDMYVTSAFSVHGINNVLDYAVYGDGHNTNNNDNESTFTPPDHATPNSSTLMPPPRVVAPPHSSADAQVVSGGQMGKPNWDWFCFWVSFVLILHSRT